MGCWQWSVIKISAVLNQMGSHATAKPVTSNDNNGYGTDRHSMHGPWSENILVVLIMVIPNSE